VAVRPGMPMPMMLSGVGAGDGDGSERRTTLRGDEDWDTSDGVDGAIGRPASLAPRAEG